MRFSCVGRDQSCGVQYAAHPLGIVAGLGLMEVGWVVKTNASPNAAGSAPIAPLKVVTRTMGSLASVP